MNKRPEWMDDSKLIVCTVVAVFGGLMVVSIIVMRFMEYLKTGN